MSTSETATDQVNEVTLVGRMSQPAEQQVLPSGSELVKFRVIVGRPPSTTSRVTVDALDCVVWTKRPARAVAGWRTGGLQAGERWQVPRCHRRLQRCLPREVLCA